MDEGDMPRRIVQTERNVRVVKQTLREVQVVLASLVCEVQRLAVASEASRATGAAPVEAAPLRTPEELVRQLAKALRNGPRRLSSLCVELAATGQAIGRAADSLDVQKFVDGEDTIFTRSDV